MLYSVLVSAEKSYVELPVALEGVVTLAEYQARLRHSSASPALTRSRSEPASGGGAAGTPRAWCPHWLLAADTSRR